MGQAIVSDPLSLALKSGPVQGSQSPTGNPHYVIFVDDFSPTWQQQAAEIALTLTSCKESNVELVKVLSEEAIEIRIYERGAGETQSSGTGSCASA